MKQRAPKFKFCARWAATLSSLVIGLSGSSCAWLQTKTPEIEGSEFEGDPIAAAAWQVRTGQGDRPSRMPASMYAPVFPQDEDEISAQQAQVDRGRREANIVLGMSPADVRRAWGTPLDVETSGGQAGEGALAERWIYPEGFAFQKGGSVQRQRRVYFEEGRVAGWDTVY